MTAPIPQLPPLPPLGLSREAVEKWHQLLPRLQRLGLNSPEDFDVLGLYCDAFGIWCEARVKIDEHGSTVDNRAGSFPSPWVSIRDQAAARMLDTGNRIGLNADNPFATRLPLFEDWSRDFDFDDDDEHVELPSEVFTDNRGGYVIVDADGKAEVLHDEA